MLSSIFAVWNYLMFGSMLYMTELESRIAEALAMQQKHTRVTDLDNDEIFQHLLLHGSITSNNPLVLATAKQLYGVDDSGKPKYASDAVWTRLAVNCRKAIAERGYVIVAVGRKPTTYKLVQLPSVAKQASKPAAPAAQASKPAAPASN